MASCISQVRLAGITQGMGSANERRRYIVTPSLIGSDHTQNDPWVVVLYKIALSYQGTSSLKKVFHILYLWIVFRKQKVYL